MVVVRRKRCQGNAPSFGVGRRLVKSGCAETGKRRSFADYRLRSPAVVRSGYDSPRSRYRTCVARSRSSTSALKSATGTGTSCSRRSGWGWRRATHDLERLHTLLGIDREQHAHDLRSAEVDKRKVDVRIQSRCIPQLVMHQRVAGDVHAQQISPHPASDVDVPVARARNLSASLPHVVCRSVGTGTSSATEPESPCGKRQ
jgi:hypothetical protein